MAATYAVVAVCVAVECADAATAPVGDLRGRAGCTVTTG